MPTREVGTGTVLALNGEGGKMKIDPNMIIGAVTPQAGRPAKGAGGSFEEILGSVQEKRTEGAVRIGGPLPGMPVDPVALNALKAGEEALDKLETYRRALENPALGLKDLEPMVVDLSRMKDRMEEAVSFLSDADPLRAVMSEMAGVLGAEVARFRRGDLVG